MNFEKYQMINFQNWTFYAEDPFKKPMKVRNCLAKLDELDAENKKFEIEITSDKLHYVWSTQDHYSLEPIDALKRELTDIINIKAFSKDENGYDFFYCRAGYKFNVCKLNVDGIDEQIVVVFGTTEKKIHQFCAGMFFHAVGLGASSSIPLQIVLSAYRKIILDAYKTNDYEFNPKNNIKAGFNNGVAELVTAGFYNLIWSGNPFELSGSLCGRLSSNAIGYLVSENTETVLNGKSPSLNGNISAVVLGLLYDGCNESYSALRKYIGS